ncbi:MAG: hypothetical protein MJZ61_06365 [Bacteroidales bacterium]|nr:hypothetical protein [Bacteroidales bacterium]
MRKLFCILAAAAVLGSCSPKVPDSFTEKAELPYIYPDYAGVTVPCNIAPLNFKTDGNCVAVVTSANGDKIVCGKGCETDIPVEAWSNILSASVGDSIRFDVFGQESSGWVKYKPFYVHVADSRIDDYVSYRLIEPVYSVYGDMCISQRNISGFGSRIIYSTSKVKNQCVNCHSFQNYGTRNMLFHKRANQGGTVFVMDGKQTTVNLKRDNTISAGVYPSWHPASNLVAFSTNTTRQLFQTKDINKVEVYDIASDLVLYDVEGDKVSPITATRYELETFPTWSPDGNTLYYCSAIVSDSTFDGELVRDYKSIRYNIMKRSFDMQSRTFGEPELVYDAASQGKSCSLPRISPDGGRMIFAEGAYGSFHIWHYDSDVRIMNLASGELDNLSGINSPKYADSYPSFSSNGQWIMLASRRVDGNYSRIYIAYVGGNTACKPFMLPQKSPVEDVLLMKSYNRPEFTREPVDM